jgi:hypothetical protein
MEMKIGKLGLKVPIQNPDKRSQISMDIESIQKWRAALPMADTGATAKKLFLLLNELNQITLEPKKRFEILELLRPPLQLICQALRKHYINQTTPLTKQKLTIANLSQTLQLEIINGYKIALEEFYIHDKDQGKALIPLIIYRIIYYYNMVLLKSYQIYFQEPSGIWQELHLLYKLAKKDGILEHKIEGILSTKEQLPTILINYTHSLLLAASNPFQWRQNEQDAINNVLNLWVPLITLRAYSAADKKKPGVFVFDLEKDLPPEPLGLQQDEPTKSTMTLDVSKICDHLKAIHKELEENEIKARIAHDKDPEYEISAATLGRLISSWNTIITRKHKRFNVNGKMQAVFGLSSTHHYVGDAKPFEPNTTAEKKKNSSNLDIAPLELTEDSASENSLTSEQSLSLELLEDENKTKSKNNVSGEKYVIYNCSLLNISPNGFCVIWENESYPLVQPGEIIATRTSEDANHDNSLWNIGVIRWLKHTTNGNIRVGVQLLAAHSKTAGAQIVKDNVPAGYFLRCLILPKMEDLNIASSIITPTLPFKQGKTINLYTADNIPVIKAKLTKQIDATSSYRQFEYETEQPIEIIPSKPIEKQSATEPTTTINKIEGNEASDKFNSIWDKL